MTKPKPGARIGRAPTRFDDYHVDARARYAELRRAGASRLHAKKFCRSKYGVALGLRILRSRRALHPRTP